MYEEKYHTILTCPLSTEDHFTSDHSIVCAFIELEYQIKKDPIKTRTRLNHARIGNELDWKLHDNILSLISDVNELCDYILNVVKTTFQRNKTDYEIKIKCNKNQIYLDNLLNSQDELKRKLRESPTTRNKSAFERKSR